MDEQDLKSVRERYDGWLREHGETPASLGWNKARHHLRFSIFTETLPLAGKSVLDFGCGFGYFKQYLDAQGIACDYTGVDINENLLAVARKNCPGVEFHNRNVLAEGWDRQHDYIVSSGVHNLPVRDNGTFMRESMKFFHAHAREAFAVNFLSDRVDYRIEHAHHTNPMEALAAAYGLTRRVILRNDYMPFEYTIFAYRRDEFHPTLAVYPEFLGRV